MATHDTASDAGILTTLGGRPIPCWECLRPAAQAIEGHPYRAPCIAVDVPRKARYLPSQEDKRAAQDAGALEWTGR